LIEIVANKVFKISFLKKKVKNLNGNIVKELDNYDLVKFQLNDAIEEVIELKTVLNDHGLKSPAKKEKRKPGPK
jgi:hypothetical protein